MVVKILLYLVGAYAGWRLLKRSLNWSWKKFHDFFEDRYRESLPWVVLEIKLPKEVKKTPLAMEQIIAGLHAIRMGPTWWQRNILGYVEHQFSLELMSRGGEVHFLIRLHPKFRDLAESLIYAQYPQAEVIETDDYVNEFPRDYPFSKKSSKADYKLWGGEFDLSKSDVFPIRGYKEFEMESGDRSEYHVDPMASMMEAFHTLLPEERLWLQINCSPLMAHFEKKFKEEGRRFIDKIMKRDKEEKKTLLGATFGGAEEWLREMVAELSSLFLGIKRPPLEERLKKEKKDERERFVFAELQMSPGERRIVEAIERNISQLPFTTSIRFFYIGPKHIYTTTRGNAVMSAFRQFNSADLNGFGWNMKLAPWVYRSDIFRRNNYYLFWKFKKLPFNIKNIEVMRFKTLWREYHRRGFGKQARGHRRFVLTTEEIATIYHLPTVAVETPELPQAETRKGKPPPELPVGLE